MGIERVPPQASLVDVIDRVLDKGIVIDLWAKVSVAGLELITIDARVVVSSIETYMKFSESMARANRAAPPPLPSPEPEPTPLLAPVEARHAAPLHDVDDDVPAWLAEHLAAGEDPPPVLWSQS